MPVHHEYIKRSILLALTSVALFSISAFGQSPAINSTDRRIAVAEKKVAADEPKAKDLQSEVEAMKAENAVVRELLRKLEEQQKTLLEQVDRLQRRLDEDKAVDASVTGQPIVPPTTADTSMPAPNAASNTPPAETDSASSSAQPASVAATPQPNEERYRDGIIIWQTGKDAKVPFLLLLRALPTKAM